MRLLAALVIAVVGLFAGLLLMAAMAAGGFTVRHAADITGIGNDQVASTVVGPIPLGVEAVYRDAASRYCGGLPWSVLAGIGWIESQHGAGRVDPATGAVTPPIRGIALDGRNRTAAIVDPSSPDGWAHAEGPMQLLPDTFGRWATVAPGRPAGAVASVDNMWDAIHTAARYLCAGQHDIGDVAAAVFRYNHDAAYVAEVFAAADAYAAADAFAS